MNENNIGIHNYYSTQSCISNPGNLSPLLNDLPSDIVELVNIIQGLILHLHWTEKYGVVPSNTQEEANLRFVSKQLDLINSTDDRALFFTRPIAGRILGTCRDYSVFLCSLLRHQGIPARARCGFGTYFTPGQYEDHWIAEYWNSAENRWVMVDAQLDQLQRETLGIKFDTLDIPPGHFITGGKAWQMCRTGESDPNKFGIFNMHGLWFVRGNLVRDVASLNKFELLPWDCWALSTGDDGDLTEDDFLLLDQAAQLSLPETFSFLELRSIYQTNIGFIVPPIISSFTGGKFIEVDLKENCPSWFVE
jgi:hypothetical protein